MGMNIIEYKTLPKKAAIYKITNNVNGKYYIGSAVNVRVRLRRHVYELIKGVHANQHLTRAVDKYGLNSFEVNLLDVFDDIDYNKLLEIEKEYIIKLNAVSDGYNNMIDSASHFANLNKDRSHIEANRKSQSIKVKCFDKDSGDFVREFKSVTEAALFFNTSSSNISRTCKGLINYIKNHTFCYSKDFDPKKNYKYIKVKKELSLEQRDKKRAAITKAVGVPVYKYDKFFKCVQKYPSKASAERDNNIKKDTIRCKLDNDVLYDGFYWYSKELIK